MNKTQIREALNKKESDKLKEVSEDFESKIKKLERGIIEDTVGPELKQLNDLKRYQTNYSDLANVLTRLVDISSTLKELQLNRHHELEYMISVLESIENFEFPVEAYTTTYSSWQKNMNQELKKLVNQREDTLQSIKSEYRKLDHMLKNMSANKFYDYITALGVELDVKTFDNKPLAVRDIDLSLI